MFKEKAGRIIWVQAYPQLSPRRFVEQNEYTNNSYSIHMDDIIYTAVLATIAALGFDII